MAATSSAKETRTSLALGALPICRARDTISSAVDVLTTLLGLVLVALVFTEVVLRFFRAQVPPAFEELSNMLFVYWVFLGAGMAVRREAHPKITAVVDRLPPRVQHHVRLGTETLSLAYFGLLTGYGFHLALTASQPSLAMGIPMTVSYLALSVGGALMFFFQLVQIAERFEADRWSLIIVPAFALAASAMYGLVTINIYLFMVVAASTLFLIGVPVAVTLGLVTLATLMVSNPITMMNYPIRLFDGLNNFVLLSIPFFMLTGTLMAHGGISQRLVAFASALVGWIRGGLGLADIVASVFFADISGSAVSDTAAIGSVMIPGMMQRGYDRPFATALQSAAGSLGMLFPPSITMILYAWVANVSVARLFLGSFLPGFLVAATFGVVTYVMASRRGYPREPYVGARVLLRRFGGAFFALLTPFIILGGILGGVFTTTEAGVIAAVYALLLGVIGYRDLQLRQIPGVVVQATVTMSRVIFIAGNAIAFSWVLIIHQGPQLVASGLLSISHASVVVLAIINVLLVALHIVLEGASTVVAVVPVLLPVLAQLHVDPVYFGIIVMLNSAAGLLMPPIGLCLYISTAISGERIEAVSKVVLPFVIAVLIDILILLLFPGIVTLLPNLVMGHP